MLEPPSLKATLSALGSVIESKNFLAYLHGGDDLTTLEIDQTNPKRNRDQ